MSLQLISTQELVLIYVELLKIRYRFLFPFFFHSLAFSVSWIRIKSTVVTFAMELGENSLFWKSYPEFINSPFIYNGMIYQHFPLIYSGVKTSRNNWRRKKRRKGRSRPRNKKKRRKLSDWGRRTNCVNLLSTNLWKKTPLWLSTKILSKDFRSGNNINLSQ